MKPVSSRPIREIRTEICCASFCVRATLMQASSPLLQAFVMEAVPASTASLYGSLKTGQKIRVWTTGRAHQVDKLGRFTPKSLVTDTLATGEVSSG